MVGVSFQFVGLNRVAADFSKAAAEAKPRATEAVTNVIEKVEETAKTFVPVDTGATRDSISSEVTASAGMVTGEAGPTTRHAVFVEWGTYKDAPQAFMGPALDRHSHELEQSLIDELFD